MADFTPTGRLHKTESDRSRCNENLIPIPDSCVQNCPNSFKLPSCKKVINCRHASIDEYSKAAFQYNTKIPATPAPCAVVMAESASCIQEVVWFVRNLRENKNSNFKIPLAIRSGRHSYIGASTAEDGIVVDVSKIKHLKVLSETDGSAKRIEVGAGNNLGELHLKLWKNLVFPGGTCPTVGVSGLTLGGGKGILMRKYGLSLDQVTQVKLVNASGEIVTANAETNPDLFWALRGGGNGNFGIVFEFTMKAYNVPSKAKDILCYFHDPKQWPRVIDEWQKCLTSQEFIANEHVWMQVMVRPRFMTVAAHISEHTEKVPSCVLKFKDDSHASGHHPEDPPLICSYTSSNYTGSLAYWGDCTVNSSCGTTTDFEKCVTQPTDFIGRKFIPQSGYQNPGYLSKEGIEIMVHELQQVPQRARCEHAVVIMDALGGKVNFYNSNATAFPHRNSLFSYQFLSYYDDPCSPQGMTEWFFGFYSRIEPHLGKGKYQNYGNLEMQDPNTHYFQENLQRLQLAKQRYDAENFFQYSQSIQLPRSYTIELLLLTACTVIATAVFLHYNKNCHVKEVQSC